MTLRTTGTPGRGGARPWTAQVEEDPDVMETRGDDIAPRPRGDWPASGDGKASSGAGDGAAAPGDQGPAPVLPLRRREAGDPASPDDAVIDDDHGQEASANRGRGRHGARDGGDNPGDAGLPEAQQDDIDSGVQGRSDGRGDLLHRAGLPVRADQSRAVTVLEGPRKLFSANNPDDFRPTVLIGALILILTFGVAGLWAALAPLDSAVHAPGQVIVESNRKTVQHLEGGIVARIAVQEGDLVHQGDLLVQLDDTQARSNFARTRNQLDALLAQEARLLAERDGHQQVSFPSELTDRDKDPEVAKMLHDQQRQFLERRQSLDGQIAILEQRIFEGLQEIEGIYAQRDSKTRQLEIFRDELKGLRELYEKGYYARTRVLAMEREVARLEGEIGAHTAEIARAESAIGEARLQIMQTEQQFREKVVEALRETRASVADLRERLVVTQDVLSRLDINAPLTGRVQDIQYHTIGGVIQAGQPIMDIVPLEDRLIIEAQVSPNDIDDVSRDQDAQVRFTALSGRTTPTIMGRVMSISADSLFDDKTNRTYYLARVEIPADQVGQLGDKKLQAGMPADVLIKTGSRTALNYLFKPLTDALARGMIEK